MDPLHTGGAVEGHPPPGAVAIAETTWPRKGSGVRTLPREEL